MRDLAIRAVNHGARMQLPEQRQTLARYQQLQRQSMRIGQRLILVI